MWHSTLVEATLEMVSFFNSKFSFTNTKIELSDVLKFRFLFQWYCHVAPYLSPNHLTWVKWILLPEHQYLLRPCV